MSQLIESKYSIFDNRLIAAIPDGFQEADDRYAAELYPYEDRPQIIMANDAGDRFCTFSLIEEQKLSSAQIEAAIGKIAEAVTNLYPSCLLNNPEVRTIEDGQCGVFEFWTMGQAGKIYNIMYIIAVRGSMMLGTWGCGLEDDEGKMQAAQLIQSLEVPRRVLGNRGQYEWSKTAISTKK